jgi:carboxymethylenebutenolidase
MDVIRSQEKFSCNDGFPMSAYVSRPNTPGKIPGIVFIYEVFGMNDAMTGVADDIAAEGFAVMLPNIFDRGSWFSCVRQAMKDMRAGQGQGIDDLIAARNWLSGQNYVEPEKIGVMGLCMGGGFALLLGKTGLFQVSAPFYGQVPQNLNGLCPVVASYGGKDKMLLKDAHRLEKELPALGIPYDMKIYLEAGHSFFNPPHNAFVRFLSSTMGMGYEPASAADAKQRLVKFLNEHL